MTALAITMFAMFAIMFSVCAIVILCLTLKYRLDPFSMMINHHISMIELVASGALSEKSVREMTKEEGDEVV